VKQVLHLFLMLSSCLLSFLAVSVVASAGSLTRPSPAPEASTYLMAGCCICAVLLHRYLRRAEERKLYARIAERFERKQQMR
jgi:hypothetical protein